MTLYPDKGIILQFFKSRLYKNSGQHFNDYDAPPNIKGLCIMSTQSLYTETFFYLFTESEFRDRCTQKIFCFLIYISFSMNMPRIINNVFVLNLI